MKYTDACHYLDSFRNFETKEITISPKRFDLSRVQLLLAQLGKPHDLFKSILIGGTNGKGSTACILTSMLYAAGYRVGLYTSPHLLDIRERIRIGPILISKRDFASTIREVRSVIQKTKDKRPVLHRLTYFEVLTVSAFLYFARKKVDCAVIEVGLGGRLDATNVVTPLFSIITPISRDHEKFLGKTLTKIAREKVGIIKRRALVLSAQQQPEVRKVLRKRARINNAKIQFAGWHFFSCNGKVQKDGIRFNYAEQLNLFLPLSGIFQLRNATLALRAVDILNERYHFRIPKKAIRDGLRTVSWPGRFQVVSQKPYIVIDGAHNESAIDALVLSMKKVYSKKRLIVIYGSSRDKKRAHMLQSLRKITDTLIITRSSHPRSCAVTTIYAEARDIFKAVVIGRSVTEALTIARAQTDPQSVILIAGSLFIVGDVLRTLKKIRGRK